MKYVPVPALSVYWQGKTVGKLALHDRLVWFQYDPAFLQMGLELSPFKLPLRPDVVPCTDRVFDGLFGLFNDSLPDGWGRLLLDRHVRKQGIAPEKLTVLDRLAYVGSRGVGALTYDPDLRALQDDPEDISLDRLAAESKAVLKGESPAVIAELMALGGSPAGARPKILVGVRHDRGAIVHGLDDLPAHYEHWMIKFTSSIDPEDNGAIEYAYSLMAREAGVTMPPTHLFPTPEGASYFGVKRFDRVGNARVHMHTISGLLHADHRMPALDYESVLKAAMVLTKSVPEVESLFRLAAFNVYACNRDDHAKNFAFLMDDDGTWHTAPAYDLTFSAGMGGEHSTTIMGEGKNPDRSHLLALGKKLGLKKVDDMIDQVRTAISHWPTFAETAGVSRASRSLIQKNIG